jgi:protein involved in polysaccharide export with SLBB domain
MRSRFIAIAGLLLLLVRAPYAAAMPPDGAYRLGTGDQVRVKVYEWRSAVGEVYGWAALNADFRVGPDGKISLPLIGSVPATGQTLDQLADAIAERLQTTAALATRPHASVEVVQFRPFYILGSVNHGGAYDYQPGITVLQAVSIAGGLRVNDPALLTFERASLTTAGELRVLRLEHSGLLARKARLQAELDESGQVSFPAQMAQQQNDPEIARLISREQAMFKARREAVSSQLEALQRLKDLLNREVASLQSKTETMDQELALLKKEVTNTGALVKQGLAVAPREFTLRQTEIEAEGKKLDVDAAILHAREDVEKADQSMIELRNKTRNETLAELGQVESKLAETAARIKTATAIVQRDQEVIEPGMAALSDAQNGPPQYVILRSNGKEVTKIAADETTSVEPGDTVEVKRGRQAGSDIESSSSGTNVIELPSNADAQSEQRSRPDDAALASDPPGGIAKAAGPTLKDSAKKRH